MKFFIGIVTIILAVHFSAIVVKGFNSASCLQSPGTDLIRSANSISKCICKRNVKGRRCSKCKRNSFLLSHSNPEGCLRCFCSKRSKTCSSSEWAREEIDYFFDRHNEGFELVLKNLSVVNGSPKLDEMTNEIFINQLPVDSIQTYYWKLPNAFLGEKLTSFGGNLSFNLSYSVPPSEKSKWNKDPAVIIMGNGLRMQHKDFPREKSIVSQMLNLSEHFWRKSKSYSRRRPNRRSHGSHEGKRKRKRTFKRSHFMKILSNVEYILIKANYRRHSDEVRLQRVSISQASETGTSLARAREVEKCECPKEYSGLSCQYCASGYKKEYIKSKKTFKCVPCKCEGSSNVCHPETGKCFSSCRKGDLCNDTNMGCDDKGVLNKGDKECICKPRVRGKSCNKCKTGFFHLSADDEQGCKTCWCNSVTSQCQSSQLFRSEIHFSSDSFVSVALINSGGTFLSPVEVAEGTATFYRGSFEISHWSLPKRFTGNLLRSYAGLLKFTVYNVGYCDPMEDNRLVVAIIDFEMKRLEWKFTKRVELNEPSTFYVELSEEHFLYMDVAQHRNHFLKILSSVKEITISVPKCSKLDYASISQVILTTAVPYDTGQPLAIEVEHCHCPPQYSGLSCENCAPGYIRDLRNKRCRRKLRRSYMHSN